MSAVCLNRPLSVNSSPQPCEPYKVFTAFSAVPKWPKNHLMLLQVKSLAVLRSMFFHWIFTNCYFVTTGPSEHGALCRPEQPHQASWAIPAVDRPHHGGVFHPGRPRARQGHGDQPHVWQTQRLHREEPGNAHWHTGMEGKIEVLQVNIKEHVSKVLVIILLKVNLTVPFFIVKRQLIVLSTFTNVCPITYTSNSYK